MYVHTRRCVWLWEGSVHVHVNGSVCSKDVCFTTVPTLYVVHGAPVCLHYIGETKTLDFTFQSGASFPLDVYFLMDFGDSDFGNFMLDDFRFFGNNLNEIRKLPPAWICDVCLYVCVCVNHSQNLFQQPLYTFQAYVVKVPISALQITCSNIFRCGVLLYKVPLALSCTFIHTCICTYIYACMRQLYSNVVVEAHCYALQCRRIDCEQIRSRLRICLQSIRLHWRA